MKTSKEISYVVDAQDRLVSVSPEWGEFARDNDAAELAREGVTGRTLWSFIHDDETRSLYRQLLARVRSGQPTNLVLRCDGPAVRRLIELRMRPGACGLIEFRSVLLASKRRPVQRLFDRSMPRSRERLRVCGWCDRVDTGRKQWAELEDAVEDLGLAGRAEWPGVEPCTCPVCREKVLHSLQEDAVAV
jgi:hypothetical protein